MPDVLQRFLVHLFVLDDREHGLRPIEQRVARTVELGVREGFFEPAVRFLDVREHPVTGWPRGAQRVARHLVLRVDAARKEHLECRVDSFVSECLLDQRVDAEGGEVPLVEDDGIAQRDGTAVVRLGGDRSNSCRERARARRKRSRRAARSVAGPAEMARLDMSLPRRGCSLGRAGPRRIHRDRAPVAQDGSKIRAEAVDREVRRPRPGTPVRPAAAVLL